MYSKFHHEPFSPDAGDWTFSGDGPLSEANGALPWLIFERDRRRFEAQSPTFRIEQVRPMMPLAYALSGGVSMRAFLAGWSFDLIRWLEKITGEKSMVLFVSIVVTKVCQAHE